MITSVTSALNVLTEKQTRTITVAVALLFAGDGQGLGKKFREQVQGHGKDFWMRSYHLGSCTLHVAPGGRSDVPGYPGFPTINGCCRGPLSTVFSSDFDLPVKMNHYSNGCASSETVGMLSTPASSK